MTDYTARSLDTTAYSARSLDTTEWSARGALDTVFITSGTETVIDTTTYFISNVHANKIGLASIELDWDTDWDANCQVIYGTAGQSTNLALMSAGDIHMHYVKKDRAYCVDELEAYTYYYFFVRSIDRYGNGKTSNFYKLRTASTNTTGDAPVET